MDKGWPLGVGGDWFGCNFRKKSGLTGCGLHRACGVGKMAPCMALDRVVGCQQVN